MKKTVKFVIFALAAAAIITVLFWGSGIVFAMLRPGRAEVPQVTELTPTEDIPVGSDVKIQFEVTIPENRSVSSADLTLPKGAVIVLPLDKIRKKWLWNRSIWQFSALIRALEPGEIPEGKIELAVSPAKRGTAPEIFNVAIPAFSAVIPKSEKPGSALELSDVMPELRQNYPALRRHLAPYKYIYIAAIVLLIIIIVMIVRSRNKLRDVPEFSCWEAALAALDALHTEIRHGDILPVAGYNALMDILRNYLELRFDLPASRQTTAEFIPELTRSDSPLPEKYRILLSSFLNSVDLIRFAKAPADLEQLDEAVRQLGGFVSATVPNDGDIAQKGVSQ